MATDEVRFRHRLFLPAARPIRKEAWQPRADVYRVPGGWPVKLERAGVRPKDVHLAVRGNTLRVQETRRDESLQAGLDCDRMEIAYSRFETNPGTDRHLGNGRRQGVVPGRHAAGPNRDGGGAVTREDLGRSPSPAGSVPSVASRRSSPSWPAGSLPRAQAWQNMVPDRHGSPEESMNSR